MPKPLRRFLSFGIALAALAAPFRPASAQARSAPFEHRPRLVVVLVIDQFRADFLSRFEPYFGENGFKMLMRNGAYFPNAHYTHATTLTGPGHATILSGSYGHVNGVTGNHWYNPATKRIESMFFDPDATMIGKEGIDPAEDDTSPRNFIGDNLGDQLQIADGRQSKVVAVSNKDRAAIMLAGKMGKAFWFHEEAGGYTTSTYYTKALPGWVKAFNDRKLPDGYMGKQWEKALPEAAYAISSPDNFPYETDTGGMGITFPHLLTDKTGKPTSAYYKTYMTTPFANAVELQFAKEAVLNEGLGQDDTPDILGVSISATDYLGHNYGPYSQEMEDMIVRLDGQLADFFAFLNQRVKKGEWSLVLTADHGGCSVPEYLSSLGLDAGRIHRKDVTGAIEAALTAQYGAATPSWVVAYDDPNVFLNRAALAEKKLDAGEVERAAGEAALTVKGMARYFTREQIMRGQLPPTQWAERYERCFFPSRSGDVLLMPKPFYIGGSYGDKPNGTTHGTPYEYDSEVPLIFYGAPFRPGRITRGADMTDLAPTLASVLHLNPPAGNEGHSLDDILNR